MSFTSFISVGTWYGMPSLMVYQHGLEKNRQVVDVFCQAAFADGLTRRRLTVDDVFAEFLET